MFSPNLEPDDLLPTDKMIKSLINIFENKNTKNNVKNLIEILKREKDRPLGRIKETYITESCACIGKYGGTHYPISKYSKPARQKCQSPS